MIPGWLSALLAFGLLIGCCVFGLACDGGVREAGVSICLGFVIVLLPALTKGRP